MPTRTGLELQLSYTLHHQNPVDITMPIQLPVINQVFSSSRAKTQFPWGSSRKRTQTRGQAHMLVCAEVNSNHGVMMTIKDDESASMSVDTSSGCTFLTVPFVQKIIAETLGTYFLIFAGCAAVVVNADRENAVTLPVFSIVGGLEVMVMVYSVDHISGAHFNPAVTIAFATCKRFPWKQVRMLILLVLHIPEVSIACMILPFLLCHLIFQLSEYG